MRLRIVHETAYRYDPPATGSIQSIRLTPRGHDGQFVINWRIEVDQDCRLEPVIDPFGNVVHSFNTEGALEGLTITALGEIETHDMAGMVRGQSERFPVGIFLRDTQATASDQAIRKVALEIGANAPADRLSKLHVVMGLLHDEFEIDGTDDDSAIATFAARKGDSRALAHVFIAMARYLGIPARYASGYLFDAERKGPVGQEYGWAEAFVEGVGWIGFDAALNLCPTDLYVRLAIGLDRIGAAPVRGTAYGTVAGAPPLTKISISESRGTKR